MVMFSTVVSAHEYTVMFITLVNGLFDHLSGKMGVNVRFKLYAIIAVLHLVYLAVFAYTRDQEPAAYGSRALTCTCGTGSRLSTAVRSSSNPSPV